jgi:hypothetical protein
MKIAICYAGQNRTWNQCIDNHLQTLIDDRCVIFSCTDKPLQGINATRHILIDDNLSLYSSKFEYFHSRKACESNVFNCLKMYYSIYKVNQLKKEYEIENNILFDIVVRVRPDILFDTPLKAYLYDTLPNTIVLPSNKDYGGLCDQFWYSGTRESDAISNLFVNIDTYFTNDGVRFHPETFLMHHCHKLNMSIDRIDTQFNILR